MLKLGGLQAFFLSAVLLKKKTESPANIMLAMLVFCLGISCLFYSYNSLDFYLQFPHLLRVDWGIPLLFGPLIYLYTLFLTNRKEKWTQNHGFHFFPYLLNLLILIPFFIKGAEDKIQVLDYFTASISSGTDSYFYYHGILRFLTCLIGIHYVLGSLKLLGVYRGNLLQEYSNIQQLKLEWLRLLLYSFLILSLVFIGISIFMLGDRYPDFDYDVYYFLLVFIFIYGLTYKTLTQPKILSLYGEGKKNSKKAKAFVKPKTISSDAKKLKRYMLDHKPYLEGELTASQLAKELQISRHQLSHLLNQELGYNFYDFVNSYRIEEFKTRLKLKENQKLTLLAIALDSGFNSKTSFNTIFKKMSGQTPRQYKKSLEISSNGSS